MLLVRASTRARPSAWCRAGPLRVLRTISEKRVVRGRRVRHDGTIEPFSASSRTLIESEGILPRDMRLLATRGANLAVRPGYYLFRFPPFTGIVKSEAALLIDDNGGDDGGGAGYTKEVVQLAADVLEDVLLEGISRARADPARAAPFEHRALDAVLREDLVRKQERFSRLSQQTTLALAVRDRDLERLRERKGSRSLRRASSPRKRSLGLLALGADSHAEEREQALYRLITLTQSLEELQVDVRRSEAVLEALTRSDEDMAALYLSHREAQGVGRAVSEHHEVEILLEGYGTQLMDLSDRIETLQGNVAAHRSLEMLKLRNERNRIMRVDLLLAMGGVSLSVSAVIGGFMGMNLSSGIEEMPGVLWLASAIGVGASASLFHVLTGGVRRFHHLQRENLLQINRLHRAVGALDHAYYALRRSGVLSVSHSAAEFPESSAAEVTSGRAAAYHDSHAEALREAIQLFDGEQGESSDGASDGISEKEVDAVMRAARGSRGKT